MYDNNEIDPAHLLGLRGGKGQAVLHALDFSLEKLVIHGHFSQLLLEPGDFQVTGVLGAFL